MPIFHVFINVRPEMINSFRKETAENIAGSIRKPHLFIGKSLIIVNGKIMSKK
ncbi:MAG TPA: hypothetical protein GXZ93_05550 [Actinobacteria bacterium]|jgi:hypothetical protein|nr:hypothetical protein [Actinomycetota bacterium]